ncbi:hypothetical protein N8609_00455 [Verrucomicrobia bacterium]|nr:hypothetical protein [Verrucomicrobiota bacterium]
MHLPMDFLVKPSMPPIALRLSVQMIFWTLTWLWTADVSAAANKSPLPAIRENVGISISLQQVVIEGTELEVIPLAETKPPIVLRIEATWPHGSSFRYDFSFYGLEPGNFDLRSQLRRNDGSSLDTVQSIPVIIESILPPGKSEPAALKHHSLPAIGGYKQWMITLGILWILGLMGILWCMRQQKKTNGSNTRPVPTLSLGEKMEPLVKAAAAGGVSSSDKAELERLLLTFWSKKLDLEKLKSSERIQKLKKHPEARPLICALEQWLHSPTPVDDAEIQSILKPYRSIRWMEDERPPREVKH